MTILALIHKKASHLIYMWSLLIALTACNDGPPIAFRDSPEAAVRQSVTHNGWPVRVSDLQIHYRHPLPQGELFLISGELGPEHDSQRTIGLVDAKRNWRGWYAHGWYDLSPVLTDDSPPLTATLLLYEKARVVVGRAVATTVAISCDDQQTHSQPTPEGLFLAVVRESREACEVRALDTGGAKIARIVVDHPR